MLVVLVVLGLLGSSCGSDDKSGQVYKECGDIFIRTCSDPHPEIDLDPYSCGPAGWYCQEGFVRDETGRCVPLGACRCGPNERLITKCRELKSQGGEVTCDYFCRCREGYERINGTCLPKPCPEDCCAATTTTTTQKSTNKTTTESSTTTTQHPKHHSSSPTTPTSETTTVQPSTSKYHYSSHPSTLSTTSTTESSETTKHLHTTTHHPKHESPSPTTPSETTTVQTSTKSKHYRSHPSTLSTTPRTESSETTKYPHTTTTHHPKHRGSSPTTPEVTSETTPTPPPTTTTTQGSSTFETTPKPTSHPPRHRYKPSSPSTPTPKPHKKRPEEGPGKKSSTPTTTEVTTTEGKCKLEFLENCGKQKNMSSSKICDIVLKCCCPSCRVAPQPGHCPLNERYDENAPYCQETCQNTKCMIPCNGCVCDKGYIRDEITHACIPTCPIPGMDTHERFEYYGYERTCQHPNGKPPSKRKLGPGYYCADGYLRNATSKLCVPKKECRLMQ